MSMKAIVAGTWSAIRILTCCYPPVPFSFSFLSWHDTALFWLSSFSNYSFSAGFLLSVQVLPLLASAFLYTWCGDRALVLCNLASAFFSLRRGMEIGHWLCDQVDLGFSFTMCINCMTSNFNPNPFWAQVLFCKLRAVPFFRIIGRITRNRIFRIGWADGPAASAVISGLSHPLDLIQFCIFRYCRWTFDS